MQDSAVAPSWEQSCFCQASTTQLTGSFLNIFETTETLYSLPYCYIHWICLRGFISPITAGSSIIELLNTPGLSLDITWTPNTSTEQPCYHLTYERNALTWSDIHSRRFQHNHSHFVDYNLHMYCSTKQRVNLPETNHQ